MYEKYLGEAQKIYNGFRSDNRFIEDWLANNGMTELYKMLLSDIAEAKNDTECDRAKFQFKQRILMPFFKEHVAPKGQEAIDVFYADNPTMAMEEPKGLGSYDELKKNPDLKQSKYAVKTVDKDGKEIVEVPLLRLVDDKKELVAAAGSLHVSPEELRDHILNEWDKKKKREWVEEEKAMRKAIVDGGEINGVKFPGRKGVLKEYDKNFWSGVLKTVAPELYAGMRRDIAEGKGEAGSVIGWVGKHKKDAVLDALRSGAVAAVPYATSNPIAVGLGVSGAGLASLAASDYYPFDVSNATTEMYAGAAAGTIPATVGMVLSKVSGMGAGWRQAARKAIRAIQRGEDMPSVNEQKLIEKTVDDAYFIYEAYRNGDYSKTSKQVQDAINKVSEMLNNSPRTVGINIPLGKVTEMLSSKEGVMEIKSMLKAPSKKTFVNWNTKAENGMYFSPEEYNAAKESIRRTEILFPETFNEITSPVISGAKQNVKDAATITLAKMAELYGSAAEPLRQRRDLKEGLSSYESSNPEQVEEWKKYGIPEWDPLAEEFKEKYGEGR